MPDDRVRAEAIIDGEDTESTIAPPGAYARRIGPGRHARSDIRSRGFAERLGAVTWEYDPAREVFTELGPGIEQLVGVSRERLYAEPGLWFRLAHPDDAEWAHAYCVAATEERVDHDLEYRMVRPDGSILWIRDTVTVVLDENDAVEALQGVFANVTDRKRLELETRQAAREFETVFGLLRGLYFRLDLTCAIKRSSASMPGLLDDALLQIDGAPIDAMLPEPVAGAIHRGADAIKAGERSSVEEILSGDEGDHSLFEVSVFPLGDDELAAVVRDVSERLAAREADERHRQQLSALAAEIERAADRERRRLAEEIHDRVSQTLAIARMRLVSTDGADGHAPDVDQVRELLEQAAHEARSLTSELAPTGLYELGISSALRALGESIEAQYGLHCVVDAPLPFQSDVDDDTRAFVFRAVRELLMNVIKHAQTDRAEVTFTREGDMLVASVHDHGAGGVLDPTAWQPGETGGFGLFSLLERAQSLGGSMEARSAPGAGTTVVVRVPAVRPPASSG